MSEQPEVYFEAARDEACKARCLRDKCGAVVVVESVIVGRGFNGPAGEGDVARCALDLCVSVKPKADRTCCVHAEWRAILEAVRARPDLTGGTLYFTRVDERGEILRSGAPYCTVCSRLALEVGVRFALWHDDGIRIYDPVEYNALSYAFHQGDPGSI